MFGSNYQPVESSPVLEDGFYTAKIIKVEMKQNSVGNYLTVEITVKDHQGCNPRIAFMNDYPSTPYGSLTLEDSQRIWNQNMTKFFDNFKINRGDFNFNGWVGKIGEVTIRQQKNSNYKEVVLWHEEPKKKAEPQTAPSQTPSFSQSAPTSPDFPEDIPF